MSRKTYAPALLLALSQTVLAAADPAVDLAAKLAGGKASVVSSFEAKEIGMTGVVMKRAGQHVIFYVDPAGKYMFSGVAIDKDGKNLMTAYNEKHLPKPDFAAMWQKAEKTAYVEYGSPLAKAVIYVVGESNCGYCKRFHRDIKSAVDKGEVAVRWILLGFDEKADDKAAGVLAAANPKDAIEALYEKNQALPSTKASQERVKANHAFAEEFGIGGTPFILSKGKDGKVRATPGAVSGEGLEKLVAAAGK